VKQLGRERNVKYAGFVHLPVYHIRIEINNQDIGRYITQQGQKEPYHNAKKNNKIPRSKWNPVYEVVYGKWQESEN